MYCFNDTAVVSYLPLCNRQPGDAAGQCHPAKIARLPFALEVEVMTRARPVGPSIPQMTISQLLVLLTGYTMDLQKMTYLGFLHDNHVGNLLLVGTGQTQSQMAWHDFGARSYFQNATKEQFESFREHFDTCYDTVIEHLKTRRGTDGLIAEEKLQQAIMQWADGSIDIRRSVLRAWSRALTPTRSDELRDFLERGATSAPSTVWVRELDSKDGKEFEPTGNAFQVKGAFANAATLAGPLNRLPQYAIKAEEELSIAASKIDIYSQKDDRNWEKEETMSASLRDTTEPNTWFR
ncbi:unnamed protein product [Symbiodinium sp. CCMP2456]|nr:unnamed protein product [Symbiodinium sp. CCMP2456]